jgi:hypothetical protein
MIALLNLRNRHMLRRTATTRRHRLGAESLEARFALDASAPVAATAEVVSSTAADASAETDLPIQQIHDLVGDAGDEVMSQVTGLADRLDSLTGMLGDLDPGAAVDQLTGTVERTTDKLDQTLDRTIDKLERIVDLGGDRADRLIGNTLSHLENTVDHLVSKLEGTIDRLGLGDVLDDVGGVTDMVGSTLQDLTAGGVTGVVGNVTGLLDDAGVGDVLGSVEGLLGGLNLNVSADASANASANASADTSVDASADASASIGNLGLSLDISLGVDAALDDMAADVAVAQNANAGASGLLGIL